MIREATLHLVEEAVLEQPNAFSTEIMYEAGVWTTWGTARPFCACSITGAEQCRF